MKGLEEHSILGKVVEAYNYSTWAGEVGGLLKLKLAESIM